MTTRTEAGQDVQEPCARATRLRSAAASLFPGRYFLPRETYFCGHGDAFVFLDLRRDKYTIVCGAHAVALCELMESPGDSLVAGTELLTYELATRELAARELVSRGLLTTDPGHGKPVRATTAVAPTASVEDLQSRPDFKGRRAGGCDLVLSCMIVTLWLRFRSIESIVGGLRQRRAEGAAGTAEVGTVAALAAGFGERRAVFPANYRCLFDSLALLEFLSRHGAFADLVFAIRFEPWAAHCWVQCGDLLLNEDLETAQTFVPILVV